MSQGPLGVGLLRGATNEYLSFDLNPAEGRERTDDGMELILKAWTEPQPFGWQGRYYQYRTVPVWPRPRQQPTYALGTSKESCDFAARNRLGARRFLRAVEAMARSTNYYRRQCREYDREPRPDHISYLANMLLAETDDAADERSRSNRGRPSRCVRRSARRCSPSTSAYRRRGAPGQGQWCAAGDLCWRPRHGVEQIRKCREVVGAGVLDLSLTSPGSGDLGALMDAISSCSAKPR